MKEIIVLDGIPLELQPPDIDKDGEIGGTELVTQRVDAGITSIIQPTELGESLKYLNDDSIDVTTRMSGIDLRSRLHYVEIGSLVALDSLVALKILPTSCLAFTRQKKRLAVSLDGKGRDDMVNIVAGKREQEAKAAGFGEKVKSHMGSFMGVNNSNQ